jgi:hypothetical protein
MGWYQRELVCERWGRNGLPVAAVMAGGCNRKVAEMVEVHLQV